MSVVRIRKEARAPEVQDSGGLGRFPRARCGLTRAEPRRGKTRIEELEVGRRARTDPQRRRRPERRPGLHADPRGEQRGGDRIRIGADLTELLRARGLEPHPDSATNFVLVEVGADANAITASLLAAGVSVQSGTPFGAPTSLRIGAGSAADLELLDAGLGAAGFSAG